MKRIIIFLLFTPCVARAQEDKVKIFTTGYIVRISGDSAYGKLAMLSPEESCDHIDFKTDSSETAETLDAGKVKFYKRGFDLYYSRHVVRPKSHIGNKDMFVKLIGTGKIKTYEYVYIESSGGGGMTMTSTPFSNGAGMRFTSYPGSGSKDIVTEFYLEKENVFKHITRLNYKGDLWSFFKGDKEMVTKVRKSEYKYESIPKMINEYNETH